jgi:hypothetical protein
MIGDEDERAIRATAGIADATGPNAAVRRSRAIDAAARARIGRGLRLHYAGILAQPIPDRLRTLLDDLAACSDTEAQR